MPTFAEMHTPNGHQCGEVTSALQKAIRRGLERDALYMAAELDLAGYANYTWKRLRLIASEDVGLADPNVAVIVRVLYENWLEQRKADKNERNPSGDSPNTRLFLTHAVLVLVRAKKSRLVDHALMVAFEGDRPAIEMPDYALDKHTSRGRKLGRGEAHFFDEASKLENRGKVEDPYEAEGRAIREGRGNGKPKAKKAKAA
jgi:replication-associated recombination protein RarA